jgi:hypothetical protein
MILRRDRGAEQRQIRRRANPHPCAEPVQPAFCRRSNTWSCRVRESPTPKVDDRQRASGLGAARSASWDARTLQNAVRPLTRRRSIRRGVLGRVAYTTADAPGYFRSAVSRLWITCGPRRTTGSQSPLRAPLRLRSRTAQRARRLSIAVMHVAGAWAGTALTSEAGYNQPLRRSCQNIAQQTTAMKPRTKK